MVFDAPMRDESCGTYGYRGVSLGFDVTLTCREKLSDGTATYVLGVDSRCWVSEAPEDNIDDHLINVLSRSPFKMCTLAEGKLHPQAAITRLALERRRSGGGVAGRL
jgi:hypothetical protein